MTFANEGEFRFIGERVRYDAMFFKVVIGTFLDPSGFTFEREIIRHSGAVCVVALEGDPPEVLLVRQFRGALNRYVLEIPAGKLDVVGEPKDLAARRELAEEIGRTAGELLELGSFYNSPGFSDEATTCFLATDLTKVERDLHGVEEENMSVVPVPLSKVWTLFETGELTDAKSLIALNLAERALGLRTTGE